MNYVRIELLRMLRNRRFFLFSLGFPLVLYLFVAGANRHAELGGISFPVYYLAGMITWGTMAAVLGGGARIAADRAIGWNRQLRTTPLRWTTYLGAKILSGYVMAVISIGILYVAGASLGVRLGAGRWVEMTALVLVGLIPFAAMGVLLGHLLSSDALGPALGGLTALFAMFGGSWGPFATSGWFQRLAELLPSYWLVQSGHVAVGASAWPAKAWVIIGVWTVVLARLAVVAFRRDTVRA